MFSTETHVYTQAITIFKGNNAYSCSPTVSHPLQHSCPWWPSSPCFSQGDIGKHSADVGWMISALGLIFLEGWLLGMFPLRIKLPYYGSPSVVLGRGWLGKHQSLAELLTGSKHQFVSHTNEFLGSESSAPGTPLHLLL